MDFEKIYEGSRGVTTARHYALNTPVRSGKPTRWIQILQALKDLGGSAKTSDLKMKVFGQDRRGYFSTEFAALRQQGYVSYNNATKELELTDAGADLLANQVE